MKKAENQIHVNESILSKGNVVNQENPKLSLQGCIVLQLCHKSFRISYVWLCKNPLVFMFLQYWSGQNLQCGIGTKRKRIQF